MAIDFSKYKTKSKTKSSSIDFSKYKTQNTIDFSKYKQITPTQEETEFRTVSLPGHYSKGEISLPQARRKIATKQQEIQGLAPTPEEQEISPFFKGVETVSNIADQVSEFLFGGVGVEKAKQTINTAKDFYERMKETADRSPEEVAQDKEDWQQYTQDTKEVISAIGEGLFGEETKEIRQEARQKGMLDLGAGLGSTLAQGAAILSWQSMEDNLREMVQGDLEGAKNIDKMQEAMGTQIENKEKFIESIQDPEFVAEGFNRSLPNLLFSMGVALPATAVGAPAVVIGGLLFGSAASLEGGFAYNEAKEFGATDEEAVKTASITGIVNGMLESFPLFKLLRRNPIKKKVLSNVVKRILNVGKRTATQTGREAGTESLQEIVANAAARTYDENRDLFQGTLEAGYFGALLGGGASIVTDVAQSTRGKVPGLTIEETTDDNLIQEASKYKSADEFLKAQETPVYHGTISGNKISEFDITKKNTGVGKNILNQGDVIYFSKDPQTAKVFSKLANESEALKGADIENLGKVVDEPVGEVIESTITDAKIKKLNYAPDTNKIAELKKQGFDGVEFPDTKAFTETLEGRSDLLDMLGDETTVAVWNTDKIKTKSQLTDIWNKGQETTKKTTKFLSQAEKINQATTPAQLKRILGKQKPTPFIRKRANTLLKDRIKNLSRGYREGSQNTRTQIEKIQSDIISLLELSNLSLADKGKFLKTVKNANTELKLQKTLPNILDRINRLENAEKIRNLKDKITKELKTTKVKKVSGKPVGKFTPIIQKALDIYRDVMKMSIEQATNKLIQNQSGIPTPEMAFENKVLHKKIYSTTLEHYQDILNDIQNIKETGQNARALKDFNKQVDLDREINYLKENITGKKQNAVATFGREEATKLQQTIRTLGHKFVLDWHGKMQVLDYFKDVDMESFADRYNTIQQDNKYKELQRDYDGNFKNLVVDNYGIKNKNTSIHRKLTTLSEEVNLGEVTNKDGVTQELKMTKDELIKRWMELQDPTLYESFIEGNRYTDTIIEKINNEMTTEDRTFARGQLDMYRDLYNQVNGVYTEIYGVDLPFNEFYSPIRREGFQVDEQQFMNEFLEEVQNRTALTSSSFISRVSNKKPIASQGSVSTLARHFSQMNHFIAWAEQIRKFNYLFRNTEVRNTIKDDFGTRFLNSIDNDINDLTTNGNKKARRIKIVDDMRSGFTIGALAIKPAIGIKQLVSTLAYLETLSPAQFTAGVVDFWKNPKRNIKILNQESTLIDTRGRKNMERDITEASKSKVFKKFSRKQSFLNVAMLNIMLGDKGAIVMGSWAMRRSMMKKAGVNKATPHIIESYEKFSAETQQSADVSRLSEIQRGGSFEKLFTMFKSSQRQYLQKEVNAIRSLLRKGGTKPSNLKKVAKTIAIYHVVLPVAFQYIANLGGWDEEDRKEYLRAGLLGSINGLFIAGDIMDAIIRQALSLRVWDLELPVMTIADGINKTIRNLTADDISSEDMWEAIEGLAEASNSFGIPAEQGLRMGQGIGDVMKADYKRGIFQILGWSPYYINKKEEITPDFKTTSGDMFELDVEDDVDLFEFNEEQEEDLFDF